DQHLLPLIKGQKHGFAAQVDVGADIFPAVDAIPGGPDDLRHVGPAGVEALPGKGPAIAGSGNGDLAGFRLAPGDRDDLRGPIVVPHLPELGVHGLKDQSPGTTLDAAVTVAADLIDGVQQLLPVKTPLPVSVHRTDFLDT